MKNLIDLINETKFKNSLSIKPGETIYAIVCDFENHYWQNRSKRDMIPCEFKITSIRDSRDGKGIFADVAKNKYKIADIYFNKSEIRDHAYNGIGEVDREYGITYYMFCANSLEDLQELMDSEVGEEIEKRLNRISEIEEVRQKSDIEIKKLRKEIDDLKNSGKLKK